MSVVFCDSSAFYAVLNDGDEWHASARTAWERLLAGRDTLVTTNYVVVESITLVQVRFGVKSARALREVITESLEVAWIDSALHDSALDDLLSQKRRYLSLVDCTSFAFMRRNRISNAFAFDKHFTEQGFTLPTS
jgi:predicted nucleic acid-binding protein